MRTSSRNVVVVSFDEMELLDVAAVVSVLGAAGKQWNWRPFRIVTAAASEGLVETRSQVRLEAAAPLASAPAPEIVVVPGGYGARRALSGGPALDFLASSGRAANHVLAIGNGVLLAARAGLAAGRDVATGAEVAAELAALDASARADTDRAWLESGPLFTAATSHAAIDATLALVSRLLGEKQARVTASSLGIPWTLNDVQRITFV